MFGLFLNKSTFTFSSVFPPKTFFQREMEKHVLILENETLLHMSIQTHRLFYSDNCLNVLLLSHFLSYSPIAEQNHHYGIDTHHILNHTHSIFSHCFNVINRVKAAVCLTAVIHGVQR